MMSEKMKINDYIEILNNIKPRRLIYSFVLICDCIVETSFYILTPLVMKLMIDASVKSDINNLKQGLFIVALICLLGIVLFGTFEFFFFSIMHKTTAKIRTGLFNHILHLPISYVEQNHSGDTISRLNNDVNIIQSSYGWPLRNIIVSIFVGITSAAVMIMLDWRVSILLISIGFISVVINSRQKDIVRKINKDIQKSMGKYTENLSNILSGFFTIKNFQLEEMMLEKTDNINNEILNSNIELTKKNAIMDSRNFLFESINFAGIIALAAFLAFNGISNLGSIVSLIFLVGNVNRMFSDTNSMLLQLQGYIAGSKRVIELLKIPEEHKRVLGGSENEKNVMIKLKNAAFSYDNKNKVLENINLTVKKGQVVALVGPSGGGKSTIMKLILGYYTLSSGQAVINEKSITDYTMTELREQIAYVPQDSYIFDGTIEDNIRYGRYDADREAIIEAAKNAHADEFIEKLDKGYETNVGERGIKLSGGQRQRIAIARAFLKNSPILLLDEATSSLDSESEQYVQEAVDRLMKNRTVLIIAHRLSTIKEADMIYVISKGKNVERGKHDELMQGISLYRRLYTSISY
ncbi:ATP-binding cassette domain-containing protein [Clostridium chromiireducens]|uniref:ATP-binding cassette domain-containing protein n=2 Tax=Clostridium chromiireducens TaxID=225345 RepID=A0A964RPQ5_9CLOT|nr:ATP-binding cassette domain-containing protein [Clostridium chromiireducens]